METYNFLFLTVSISVFLPTISVLGFEFTKVNKDKTTKSSDTCAALTLGGIDWILSVRQPDYGWKENTHRAVIALAVSDWTAFTKEEERRLMEQQLEVEITKALLRNDSSPIYPNNLALFIHGLIATNRNPRDFHGIDLVFHLHELVRTTQHTPHPFLLLALCNAKSHLGYYLNVLEYYLNKTSDKRQDLEYKALSLQAYECAETLKEPIKAAVALAAKKHLASQQYPDGSFGNVYTTALIVQALAASRLVDWKKQAALDYLKEQSYVNVNMISTYLIQLALNAERVKFIKDLFPDLSMEVPPRKKHTDNFIQYSLRVGAHPDVHHTISINVPPNSNFFEVMKLCAENDQKYNFSYYMDKNNMPSVYAISGVPNDAEENMYWRLCYQTGIDHNRHTSNISSIHYSPILLVPRDTDHVIYWYKDTECQENS